MEKLVRFNRLLIRIIKTIWRWEKILLKALPEIWRDDITDGFIAGLIISVIILALILLGFLVALLASFLLLAVLSIGELLEGSIKGFERITWLTTSLAFRRLNLVSFTEDFLKSEFHEYACAEESIGEQKGGKLKGDTFSLDMEMLDYFLNLDDTHTPLMRTTTLIPQDDKVAEELFAQGKGVIKDGKIEVKIPSLRLSLFLKRFPAGVSFVNKETGETYELVSQEKFLEERIINLMANLESNEKQMESFISEQLRMLEFTKGVYNLNVTKDCLKGKIGEREVVYEWRSGKILVPAISDESGFDYNGRKYRCYEPRKETYQRFINNFDFQPLFMLLEEALTGKTSPLKQRVPLAEEERRILIEKFYQMSKVDPKLIKEGETYLRDNLYKTFLELSARILIDSRAETCQEDHFRRNHYILSYSKRFENSDEWRWLEEIYCPAQRIFLNKEFIQVKGPRGRWILNIGPSFSLTLKLKHKGLRDILTKEFLQVRKSGLKSRWALTLKLKGEEWKNSKLLTLDTVSLMIQLGPDIAIQTAKLYGQRRIPAMIVLILDALHLLEQMPC